MNWTPKVGDRVRIRESSDSRHVGQICIVERVFDDGVMLRIPESNPYLTGPNDNLWYFDFSRIEPLATENEAMTS